MADTSIAQEPRRVNYKSDFDFILPLLARSLVNPDAEPVAVGWPAHNWTAKFFTERNGAVFTASCIDGVCTNCFNDNNRIHVVCHRHGLSPGMLHVEFYEQLPDTIYPGGKRLESSPQVLNIEIVRGPGDCATTAEAPIVLSYVMLRYADLTEEEKAELQSPATEAAKIAEAGELRRVANEQYRHTNEVNRQTAETTRQSNELKREKAEADREEAETKRESAEESRAGEFATWQNEIDSKADRSELSNVLAEEPLTPDNFPDIDTYTREELKMDLFIDMWNSACGQYGKYAPQEAPDAEHPFLLNGLWLTYNEAIIIYYEPLQQPNDYSYKYASKHGIRTNICTFSSVYYETVSASRIAFGSNTLETIRLSSNTQGFWADNYNSAFRNCPKLKTILPIIYDSYLSKTKWDKAFEGSPLLEHVLISELRSSVSFSQCPKLSLDSLTHLVANAANTAAITITVHPDVYAKLTDESNTEWHQVLTDATTKNIIIATV